MYCRRQLKQLKKYVLNKNNHRYYGKDIGDYFGIGVHSKIVEFKYVILNDIIRHKAS